MTKDTTFAPIVMKSGVPVLADVGRTPIIDAGAASYAVQFPSDSNAATELVGFTLQGGSLAVVDMAGPGRLSHCTVTNDGDACSSAIKISGSGSAVIDSCTVTLVNSVSNRAGIHVDSGDPVITGCEVRVPGASNGIGIQTDSGTGSTISWCFITATKNGIDAGGTTLTTNCTVDSTYFEGIVNGDDAVVENSIVTNVLYDNPPYTPHPGISGGTATYCIAPNGISVISGTGNSTADPLYCDPAERTLRVDSYGNPEHNGSEELIGRFPVACMTGELVRTSTFAGGQLDMLGTVTVPQGTTLTLRPGTAVTVDSTGTPELRVVGTLLVAPGGGAASTFRSSSQTAGSGCWRRPSTWTGRPTASGSTPVRTPTALISTT